MSREWKPGDVAMLTVRELDGPVHHVGLCYQGGTVRAYGASDGVARWVWALEDHSEVWSSVDAARPLVVIDPEDREAVKRLLAGHLSIYDGMDSAPRGGEIDSMQAALREFANPKPPKPEEPQGLGAVVEDEEGYRYIRTHVRDDISYSWSVVDEAANKPFAMWEWSNITAVRVLSPGVEVDQ